jgi:hypothetical protein
VAIGAVGGSTAIIAAIAKFWSGRHAGAREAIVAAIAALLVSAIFAVAIIVSANVKSRALGVATEYLARADDTSVYLQLIQRGGGVGPGASV